MRSLGALKCSSKQTPGQPSDGTARVACGRSDGWHMRTLWSLAHADAVVAGRARGLAAPNELFACGMARWRAHLPRAAAAPHSAQRTASQSASAPRPHTAGARARAAACPSC
eukprot:2798935-Prymnesium_polylepis.1